MVLICRFSFHASKNEELFLMFFIQVNLVAFARNELCLRKVTANWRLSMSRQRHLTYKQGCSSVTFTAPLLFINLQDAGLRSSGSNQVIS